MAASTTALRKEFQWLTTLKAAQLHRVAVAIGASCSGTKPALMLQVQHTLGQTHLRGRAKQSRRETRPACQDIKPILSVLSIDVGLRNLAYAHFTLPNQPNFGDESGPLPTLTAWQHLAIMNAPGTGMKYAMDSSIDSETATRTPKYPSLNIFDPDSLATLAQSFIFDVVKRYNPSHVLIERQRFRSGGGRAVLDWTLRVGVFEGMLHAVLKTLIRERDLAITTESMDPARIARYWLEGTEHLSHNLRKPERETAQNHEKIEPAAGSGASISGGGAIRRPTGKEAKKAKVKLVGKALDGSSESFFRVGDDADPGCQATIDGFLAEWKKPSGHRVVNSRPGVGKLDDLADCLLQGIAWMRWQVKRAEGSIYGTDAFDLLSQPSDETRAVLPSKLVEDRVSRRRRKGTGVNAMKPPPPP